jgi:hypothetical protein
MPGDNLFSRLAEDISKTDAVIVILSEKGVSSSWVQAEIAWALSQKGSTLPIIPVLRTVPDLVPFLLRNRTYLEFSDESNFEEKVLLLSKAIVDLIEHPRQFQASAARELFLQVEKHRLETEIESERGFDKWRNAAVVSSAAGLAIAGSLAAGITLAASHIGEANSLFWLVVPVLTSVIGYGFGSSSLFRKISQTALDHGETVQQPKSESR